VTGGAQVIFTPSGRRGRFEAGVTILDAARSLGVDLDSVRACLSLHVALLALDALRD